MGFKLVTRYNFLVCRTNIETLLKYFNLFVKYSIELVDEVELVFYNT